MTATPRPKASMKSMNKASGSLLQKSWYVFDHADEITRACNETLGVDLNHKYLRLGEIK